MKFSKICKQMNRKFHYGLKQSNVFSLVETFFKSIGRKKSDNVKQNEKDAHEGNSFGENNLNTTKDGDERKNGTYLFMSNDS